MTIFVVSPYRYPRLAGIALYAGWGALLLGLSWAGTDTPSQRVVALVAAAVIWLLPLALGARTVVELRVLESGHLEIVRLVGSTRIAVSHILAIEGLWSRDEDGDDFYRMCICFRGGDVCLDQFARSTEFVAAVRAFHPAVPVTGLWPQGPP
jgi:hypothetical protein